MSMGTLGSPKGSLNACDEFCEKIAHTFIYIIMLKPCHLLLELHTQSLVPWQRNICIAPQSSAYLAVLLDSHLFVCHFKQFQRSLLQVRRDLLDGIYRFTVFVRQNSPDFADVFFELLTLDSTQYTEYSNTKISLGLSQILYEEV